ncbi:hypothetical protein GCM10022386_16230 [Flavobacterium cheonhonense]|uniref:Restriction endonuclease type IV Mrr domain-containing protein n=1 Tax=Flavobacterium cheonhonense TaxID=706185 RepID=A0ABP7TY10_9FLAO|nr:hypothetical protein [Flavobacterium cheonhonense]
MYRNSPNRIFSGKGSISEYFRTKVQGIQSEINSASENYILNVSEEQFAQYLVDENTIEEPIIHFDDVYADHYEKEISAEDFPQTFHVYSGERYKRKVIQFFVPITGNSELLKYMPGINTITLGGGITSFEVEHGKLKLEVIDFYDNPQKIRQNYDDNVKHTHDKYSLLKKNIEEFNNSLYTWIIGEIRKRKNEFLAKNEFMSSLGVPLKKKENTTETFAVPKPPLRTKIKVDKPEVKSSGFKPEPTLTIEIYNQILKLINDVGKNFERLPSVYKDKGEEDLRDHIIMILDPNFENGSVTGETFNKTGKTDIQLRYDSSVVFIAECKFWTGEKGFLATIDQLLKYLTWRDTKASVIMFVRQKDFTSILSKVEIVTKTHSNYIAFVNKSDENWFNYRFHLNGDKNREVKMAIQLFHIP